MAKIAFDFLTLTSKKVTLRAFFFFLIKKVPLGFTLRSKFMKIGGPAYKGFAFTKAPSGKRNRKEFFVGQRCSPKGYEYIIAIPGEICNLFVFDFLKNSNLLNGKWQITRLDLQLTLGYEFADDNQLMLFYWQFYKNQRALEKKAKKNKVKFTANGAYLLVSVGSKKQDRSEWKVYSSTLDGPYPKEINVRFEVTLKNSSQYLNCLGESDGCIEKCNFKILQRGLLEADETFLLSKHRSLVQDWSSYLKAQNELGKTKVEPRRKLDHQTKQESRSRGPCDALGGSEEATRGVISSGSRKSHFSEELALVSQALESLSQMVRHKRQTFSPKRTSKAF